MRFGIWDFRKPNKPPLPLGEGRGEGAPRKCFARTRRSRRRGLAPLEFVLWLPVLLFVMALMVNYGTLATWRVRAEVISRHAVWRERTYRSGELESPPDRPYWPDDAVMTTAADVRPDVLDVPEIDHPVVRGPIPNDFVVTRILDPARGARKGVSSVQRDYPMLSRMGDYDSGDVENSMIVGKWQVAEMGFSNWYRRTQTAAVGPILYQLPKTDPSLPDAYSAAIQGLTRIPHFEDLRVLDRDEDLRRYTGRYIDFHPRVGVRCELDRAVVRERQVVPIVDIRTPRGIRLGQISGLPRRMTNTFLSTYRRALRALEAELERDPPPTPRRRAEILAEIRELERKIEQLEAYLERMPQIEDDLRTRAGAAIP